jgi:hypothetical protein
VFYPEVTEILGRQVFRRLADIPGAPCPAGQQWPERAPARRPPPASRAPALRGAAGGLIGAGRRARAAGPQRARPLQLPCCCVGARAARGRTSAAPLMCATHRVPPPFFILQPQGPPVDIVDVFRKPSDLPPHLEDILAAKPKTVWLQSGITHPEFEAALAAAGIQVVADRWGACPFFRARAAVPWLTRIMRPHAWLLSASGPWQQATEANKGWQ